MPRYSVEQLAKLGYNGDGKRLSSAKPDNRKTITDTGNFAFWQVQLYLANQGITTEREYRFHPQRKWRFDLACPTLKIAWEYEGIFADKSRHTSHKGYTADSTKYNQAQILGWRVLRYTAKNKAEIMPDLLQIINQITATDRDWETVALYNFLFN